MSDDDFYKQLKDSIENIIQEIEQYDPYKDEIWKDIPGYENVYQVSTHGRLKSLEKKTTTWNGTKTWPETIISPILQKSGYYHVGLWKNQKCKQSRLHRLVAEAFIPNDDPKNKTQVNHKNELKHDNHVDNLEWVTPKENTNYGNCISKRSKSRAVPVDQYSLNGEYITTFSSQAEANTYLGKAKNDSHISSCCNGKQFSAYGYMWKYANK